MKISTKGRYALRVMIYIAINSNGEFISLKSIATKENISMKYLEVIVAILGKAGILESQRGKAGGYRLTREPKDYTVKSILEITEASLSPINCVGCEEIENCDHAESPKTLPMWEKLDTLIMSYLDGVTLEDLVNN